VFWGYRGQTRGQTCQATAKKPATAKSSADTRGMSRIRPVRMRFNDRYTSGTQEFGSA
jgi:hypothetical protein